MPAMDIPNERIAARAYERFLARGGQHGHDVDDWLAAKAELERDQLRFDVVLADAGARVIEVVRLLRELTGRDLRALKDAVEFHEAVTESAPFAAADELRRRLEALGARVELRPAQVHSLSE